ncbi:hypothetical protein GCM10007242_25830 [Pigmentiphaga litoralis]|nr:hypothetical protein GCM10007242_25830 [Pigmentiphaga litoralis]
MPDEPDGPASPPESGRTVTGAPPQPARASAAHSVSTAGRKRLQWDKTDFFAVTLRTDIMWLLLLEAALALALLVFIVMWTVWPKRKQLGQELRKPPAADAADPGTKQDPTRDPRGQ